MKSVAFVIDKVKPVTLHDDIWYLVFPYFMNAYIFNFYSMSEMIVFTPLGIELECQKCIPDQI